MADFESRHRNSLANALRSQHGGAEPPLSSMHYPTNNGLWFNSKLIKLDGWAFVGCRFDNCKLIIETPHFTLKNCYIDSSNMIELHGALMNAVKFLNIAPGQAQHPALHPVRNADGTVSVGG